MSRKEAIKHRQAVKNTNKQAGNHKFDIQRFLQLDKYIKLNLNKRRG